MAEKIRLFIGKKETTKRKTVELKMLEKGGGEKKYFVPGDTSLS